LRSCDTNQPTIVSSSIRQSSLRMFYPEDCGIAESVGSALATALSTDVPANPAPAVIRS
jgi:hypothetical protein